MSIEGKLSIRLNWDGRHLEGATLSSSRPFQASRLLCNIRAQEAIDRVPLIFSLCGKSQTAAARLACEAALGGTSSANTEVLEQLVMLESVQEYLWRILIDLPSLQGEGPVAVELAQIRALITKAENLLTTKDSWKTLDQEAQAAEPSLLHKLVGDIRVLVENNLLGLGAESLLAMKSTEDVANWLNESKSPIARQLKQAWEIQTANSEDDFLPQFPDDELAEQLWQSMGAGVEFTRLPRHQGTAVETGALSRLRAHPLIVDILKSNRRVAARFISRLLELAKILSKLGSDDTFQGQRVGAKAVSTGVGGSWVETARGLLMHRVEIQGGKILDYRILAPTEWNFHPQGRLVKELQNLQANSLSDLEKRASMVCLSMDPCVGFEIEVNHA